MGAAFMILLPECMTSLIEVLKSTNLGRSPAITQGLPYLKEMAIGLAIVLFLVFEPDGLAHRCRQINAYWTLYPFPYCNEETGRIGNMKRILHAAAAARADAHRAGTACSSSGTFLWYPIH